jgi:O-antigen/teichoic acid export membrane protein
MNFSSDKKRVFFNSVVATIATILDKFIFIIINIIIARFLGKVHYDEYTTALGYATFFSTFTNIGINQTLIRAINLDRNLEREHFANTLIIKTILSVIVYIVLVISLNFTGYNENTMFLILIIGIVRIGNEYLSSFYAIYDAKEKFFSISFFNSTFSLSILSGTILVILYNGDYFDLVNIRLAVVILFISIITFLTLRNLRPKINLLTIKDFFKNSIPFAATSILGNINQNINIVILSLLKGTIYSGIFTNGMMFIKSLIFIPMTFSRVLIPYLYKINFKENKEKFQFAYDLYSKYLAIISFYIFIILFLYSHELIVLIFSKKYIGSVEVLRVLSLCLPVIFTVSGSIITALDLQKYNTYFYGITAIINIIANVVLIHYFDAIGAAIAIIVTQLILYILTHGFLSLKNYVKYKNILLIFIKLYSISFTIFIINHYLFSSFYFLISFFASSTIYIIMISVLILTKDDLRILKEIFNREK